MIARLPGDPAWAVVLLTQSVNNGSIEMNVEVVAVSPTERGARDLLYELGPYAGQDCLEAFVCETTMIDPKTFWGIPMA